MSKKALSFEERIERIRRAVYRAAMGPDDYGDGFYVEYVYEGYVIVREYDNGLYFRVDYTESADGITAQPRAAWQAVEKEWAAKSIVLAQNNHALKALGNGKVGGYLVLFSSPEAPDLTGVDYFDAATDFDIEDGAKTAVYYQHGLDATLKRRRIGTGTLKQDDVGVWLEAQLELRDDYEKAIYGLVEAGKCGLSSGTASHLVEREPTGKAMHIKRWPLGLDASITPTPCEPRTSVLPLKSLIESNTPQVELQAAGDAATAPATATEISTHPTQEDSSVNEEQIKQFIQDAVKAALADAATTSAGPVDTQAVIDSAVAAAVKTITEAPAVKTAGVHVPAVHIQPEADAAAQELKSFQLYVRRGIVSPDMAAKAALNTTVDATGGYLVPQKYGDEITAALKELSVIRQAGARVISISGTDNYEEPSRTGSTAAVLTAEAAAFDEVEPTLGNIVWNPYKYTRLVKTSQETLSDSRVDVVSQVIVPDVAEAFDAAENAAFTTGTGTNQPQGLITGASLGKTAASATAVTMDEIIDLIHSVFYGYRSRPTAGFMMHDSIAAVVRKLKGSDGQYYWQPSTQVGQPDRLLGFPVRINNSMDPAMTTGKKIILFGEFAQYKIVDFAQLEMMRLNELYAANGQVGFRWFKRFDGNVMLSAALKYLQLA